MTRSCSLPSSKIHQIDNSSLSHHLPCFIFPFLDESNGDYRVSSAENMMDNKTVFVQSMAKDLYYIASKKKQFIPRTKSEKKVFPFFMKS